MEKIDRIKLAIERGYTYNPETGIIYNKLGKEIKRISNGYIKLAIYIDKKQYTIFGHHFGWYWINKSFSNNTVIDHINQFKNDNKIENLREVTLQENLFNTKAKGYSFDKLANKFRAHITINKKRIHLGYYNTEEEARQVYLTAKEKYHIIEKRH